jgi:hypothetical protein
MSQPATRRHVLAFRVAAQQLDRDAGTLDDTAVLDLGVQDTGTDGASWALANRGVSDQPAEELATVWTLRGAPHVYRRTDLPQVRAAVEPWSDADAGKRIFDASKPLKAAGIGNLEALDAVAEVMRAVATSPMVKGDVSRQVADRMDAAYLRECRVCQAVHLYEQPFRLAAFRAGLELEPGTSPPVLRRITEPRLPAGKPGEPEPAFDLVRGCLRLLGPTTPQHVAAFVDAPVRDVRARWPRDVTEVTVEGDTRWVLDEDADALAEGAADVTRLLGPFDLFLQARDRDLLVPDAGHAKALWPTIGRPGAVLHRGQVAGMWRPRKSGKRLSLQVEAWSRVARPAVEEQAERLAAHRGVTLGEVRFG